MSLMTWTTSVDRSPADVFDYLADFARHTAWSPRPLVIEPLTDGPLGVGSRFRSVGSLPRDWRKYSNDVEVTAVERPSRLAFAATEHARVMGKEHKLVFKNEFVVTPVGTRTNIERKLEIPAPSGVLGLILPILGRYIIKPGVWKSMTMLRDNLDQQRDQSV